MLGGVLQYTSYPFRNDDLVGYLIERILICTRPESNGSKCEISKELSPLLLCPLPEGYCDAPPISLGQRVIVAVRRESTSARKGGSGPIKYMVYIILCKYWI